MKNEQRTDLLSPLGQRYDIIVEANQASVANAFWLRAVPQTACSRNSNADNIRGIVYYEASTSLPTTTAYDSTNTCEDENASKLIPIISQPLTIDEELYNETLPATAALDSNQLYRWQLNGTSMHLNWTTPTLRQILNADPVSFPPNDAVISVPRPDTWVLLVIETTLALPHPVHLHGHDFLVVSQGTGPYTPLRGLGFAAGSLPKRDTALLPGSGHLVLAFRTDNPGAWLLHCHIGWHLEQGFALQFIEREDEIRNLLGGEWSEDIRVLEETCVNWEVYWAGKVSLEKGSGV